MGVNIKVARIKKYMTQEELCEKANISRSTLSNLEQGKGNPSLNLMLKLSTILDTPIDELFLKR